MRWKEIVTSITKKKNVLNCVRKTSRYKNFCNNYAMVQVKYLSEYGRNMTEERGLDSLCTRSPYVHRVPWRAKYGR